MNTLQSNAARKASPWASGSFYLVAAFVVVAILFTAAHIFPFVVLDCGTVVSIFVGAVITWAVAHIYYKRAGDQLRAEAANLRELVSMILTSMEHQGLAKLNRDSAGNITGFVYEHIGTGGVKVGGSAKVEFVSAKPGGIPP